MTNREWLLNKMQNMSDEELVRGMVFRCTDWGIRGENCINKECFKCRKDWLKSEHKESITLSEAERIILENIDKEYGWICRDEDGSLYLCGGKSKKGVSEWHGYNPKSLVFLNHLFQFITWEDEEPYNIAELLEVNHGDKD